MSHTIYLQFIQWHSQLFVGKWVIIYCPILQKVHQLQTSYFHSSIFIHFYNMPSSPSSRLPCFHLILNIITKKLSHREWSVVAADLALQIEMRQDTHSCSCNVKRSQFFLSHNSAILTPTPADSDYSKLPL